MSCSKVLFSNISDIMEDMEDSKQTQDPAQAPEMQSQPQPVVVGKPVHRHWAVWVLTALLVLSLAGNGYLWMQLQTTKDDLNTQRTTSQNLQKQVQELQSQLEAKDEDAGGTEETACTYTPGTALKDNIKAALDSKNTAAFASYVTSPVKYVLAASEQGGNVSADQAATNLAYTHSATGPWTFVDASNYSTGDYADYFGENTLVAKSADSMVVAFEFDCDGSKISEIFVAPNEDLL